LLLQQGHDLAAEGFVGGIGLLGVCVLQAVVALAAGLLCLFAEIVEEGGAAALVGADVVEHGFEPLGGLLLEGVVVAFGKGKLLNVDAWSGEDDLGP